MVTPTMSASSPPRRSAMPLVSICLAWDRAVWGKGITRAADIVPRSSGSLGVTLTCRRCSPAGHNRRGGHRPGWPRSDGGHPGEDQRTGVQSSRRYRYARMRSVDTPWREKESGATIIALSCHFHPAFAIPVYNLRNSYEPMMVPDVTQPQSHKSRENCRVHCMEEYGMHRIYLPRR